MRDYRRSRHACGECIGEGQKYEDLFHDEFPDGFREAARLDSFTANSAAQATFLSGRRLSGLSQQLRQLRQRRYGGKHAYPGRLMR
jgi:hypothetical protein